MSVFRHCQCCGRMTLQDVIPTAATTEARYWCKECQSEVRILTVPCWYTVVSRTTAAAEHLMPYRGGE